MENLVMTPEQYFAQCAAWLELVAIEFERVGADFLRAFGDATVDGEA